MGVVVSLGVDHADWLAHSLLRLNLKNAICTEFIECVKIGRTFLLIYIETKYRHLWPKPAKRDPRVGP